MVHSGAKVTNDVTSSLVFGGLLWKDWLKTD